MDKHLAPWSGARRAMAHLLAASCTALAGPAVAASYTLVDLATLAPGASVVRGPNAAGIAVGGGRLTTPGASTRPGLVFEPSGVLAVDGLPGSDRTDVLGANDVGLFVGASNTAAAVRGFVVPRAGSSRELLPLAGDTASIAYSVNNAGRAVGFSSGPAGERAVAWTAAGQPVPLAGAAAVRSQAYAVNQRGDAVGVTGTSASRRATLWSAGGGATPLSPLAGFDASEAASINSAGSVVGYSATAAEVRRATLWQPSGAALDLGALPGDTASQAFGINDAGAVVGGSVTQEGMHAFLWTASTGMQDLNAMANAPGLVLTKAVGITNQGAIVAIGHEQSQDAGVQEHVHEHELPIRIVLLIPSGG